MIRIIEIIYNIVENIYYDAVYKDFQIKQSLSMCLIGFISHVGNVSSSGYNDLIL